LKTSFVDTGKLRVVSRHLPLAFHNRAEPAARAGICAARQDKFWPFREKLFAANANLSDEAITKAASDAGLDMKQFGACFVGKAAGESVATDAIDAQAVGITGTPSFVLGKVDGDKVTGLLIIGAQALATFESEINKRLTAAK
jgi:protein-disulfide isomerase